MLPFIAGTVFGTFLFFVAYPLTLAWGKRRQEKWRAERTWIEGKPPSDEWTWYQRVFAGLAMISMAGIVVGTALKADWFGIAALGTFGVLGAAAFLRQRLLARPRAVDSGEDRS
jgi:hypothetical protein